MTKTNYWKFKRQMLIILDNYEPTHSNMMYDEVIEDLKKIVKNFPDVEKKKEIPKQIRVPRGKTVRWSINYNKLFKKKK